MTYYSTLPSNKFHQANTIYYSKKGRKNSTPKAKSTSTFSPDGAITLLFRSSLGSHSFKNFFKALESEIGICGMKVTIFVLSSSPSTSNKASIGSWQALMCESGRCSCLIVRRSIVADGEDRFIAFCGCGLWHRFED